jgi:hypothetical protein
LYAEQHLQLQPAEKQSSAAESSKFSNNNLYNTKFIFSTYVF